MSKAKSLLGEISERKQVNEQYEFINNIDYPSSFLEFVAAATADSIVGNLKIAGTVDFDGGGDPTDTVEYTLIDEVENEEDDSEIDKDSKQLKQTIDTLKKLVRSYEKVLDHVEKNVK